jgi:hypothetical protein
MLIGVSPATLRRWSDAGEIVAFTTPGGHRRFSRSAILGMLSSAGPWRPNPERLGATHEWLSRVHRRQVREATEGEGVARLGSLSDTERGPFRDHGRRIAASLLDFIDATTPDRCEASLADAEADAEEYGRIAGSHGVAMRETVELFLRFRMPLIRELAGAARRGTIGTAEAAEPLEAATEAIDRLLIAMICGHERAAAGCAPAATAVPRTSPSAPIEVTTR